jgi:hypothetical protein
MFGNLEYLEVQHMSTVVGAGLKEVCCKLY